MTTRGKGLDFFLDNFATVRRGDLDKVRCPLPSFKDMPSYRGHAPMGTLASPTRHGKQDSEPGTT
jgi:hypothetical protein